MTYRHIDAIRLAETLRDRLVNFTLDDQYIWDAQLRGICKAIWEGKPENGGLVSELWVEGTFAAKTSNETLYSLVEQGVFSSELCAHLNSQDCVPSNRLLYLHQHDAIVRASRGDSPAMLITAGTGAGKTESFLLPMLNELYSKEKRGSGVQCIILYPMNALVNDQVERLYEWLKGQSRLKLFHFTSETPESVRDLYPKNKYKYDSCRMISRQQARGRENEKGDKISGGPQPDIMVTNYSMLEYMLCRPQDNVFFGRGLRCLILDEAHFYTGTLAAEITLLLRRLLQRCGVKPEEVMQIATSATIGRGDREELRSFASTIFSKPIDMVEVIIGELARIEMPEPVAPEKVPTATEIAEAEFLSSSTIGMDREYQPYLVEDQEQCEALKSSLRLIVGDKVVDRAVEQSKNIPALLLYHTLRHSPLIQRIEGILWRDKRLKLSALADELWSEGGGEKAVLKLLQLGAAARMRVGDLPLLPHRIHLLARSVSGLGVCINPECTAPAEMKLVGAVTGNVTDRCRYCDSVVLSIYRCSNCGEWLLVGVYRGGRYSVAITNDDEKILLSLKRPKENITELVIDPTTGERGSVLDGGMPLYEVQKCQKCGENDLEPFSVGRSISLSIISEAILSELPEYPSKDNIWLPARGRRMLAFSDSRSSAARLGPSLSRQHELQLIRAALVSELRNNPVSEGLLKYRRNKVMECESNLRANRDTTLTSTLQKELERAQKELREAEVGRSLKDWIDEMVRKERGEDRDEGYFKRLHELIDFNNCIKHFTPWNQDKWENNYNGVLKELELKIGQEIARRVSKYISIESIGLAEVTYPGLSRLKIPDSLLGQLPTESVRNKLTQCWTDYLAALCDTLRKDGVCTLGEDQQDLRYHSNLNPIGKWAFPSDEGGRKLVRFLGKSKTQLRRNFTAQVLRSCGAAEADELAKKVLRAAYDTLLKNAGTLGWIEVSERKTYSGITQAIRLNLKKLTIRSPLKVYRCRITNHIWPRSVMGSAPEKGCDESLVEVTQEELDKDPRIGRIRSELQTSEVFKMGLWAEEHSAQLSPDENRRIQDLFKAGVRNILSSTTTLELGIDIGGLNAVLMSNVPPGKANYLQRAGRAGRRADGSSIVVTFCNNNPFEREVFYRFGDYLDMPLRQPVVMLDRERIVRRHFNSFMLGEFFRELLPEHARVGAMTAYGVIGSFTGRKLPRLSDAELMMTSVELPDLHLDKKAYGLGSDFLDFLSYVRDSGRYRYAAAVENLFKGSTLEHKVSDWEGLLDRAIEDIQIALQDWCKDYDALLRALRYAVKDGYKRQTRAILYQLETLYYSTVIEELSNVQVLPRYGFPVNVHKLRVVQDSDGKQRQERQEDRFRLERGGLLALSEYVPGSQLIAGGHIITSRGLLKHWSGTNTNSMGLTGVLAKCERDHYFYSLLINVTECLFCHNRVERTQDLFFPSHGFSTAAWDPPQIGTEVKYVDGVAQLTVSFNSSKDSKRQENFASIAGLTAVYQENGEVLVYNTGDKNSGFIICSKCGYAESDDSKKSELPKTFLFHAPLDSKDESRICLGSDETNYMRERVLASREPTDLLLIDFSECLRGYYRDNYALVYTLTCALKVAGTRLLHLDSRELGLMVMPTGNAGEALGGVLYDNVPGGAGHVLELMSCGHEWMESALQILYVNEVHHKICKTACLDCLLTFDSAGVDYKELCRELAYQVLKALREGEPLKPFEQKVVVGELPRPGVEHRSSKLRRRRR